MGACPSRWLVNLGKVRGGGILEPELAWSMNPTPTFQGAKGGREAQGQMVPPLLPWAAPSPASFSQLSWWWDGGWVANEKGDDWHFKVDWTSFTESDKKVLWSIQDVVKRKQKEICQDMVDGSYYLKNCLFVVPHSAEKCTRSQRNETPANERSLCTGLPCQCWWFEGTVKCFHSRKRF